MYSVTKKLSPFCAAHRLVKNFAGKCGSLHGHNYDVFVTLSAPSLDEYDFIIDLSEIKRLFDNWVQKNLDQATLVYAEDSPLLKFLETNEQKHYIFSHNTSIEVLSKCLFEQFSSLLKSSRELKNGVKVDKVKTYETYSIFAEYGIQEPLITPLV